MANTKIEWTDKVWNPVTGCSKVSQGCKNCYAEGVADRFFAKQYPPNADGSPRKFTDVRCHEDRLDAPLHWRKPARIFVNSMSDLFHENVPDEFIDRVFVVMALCPQHMFQVLTKRPERMLKYVSRLGCEMSRLAQPACDISGSPCAAHVEDADWPLRNVWLGVSVEDQKTADERIPLLLETPAAVRWISAEPLLGLVELDCYLGICPPWHPPYPKHWYQQQALVPAGWRCPIHWIVVGGESGPGARPMHPQWVRSLRDQCKTAGVPFFFKQWGEWSPSSQIKDGSPDIALKIHHDNMRCVERGENGEYAKVYRVGKKAAGRLLDGVEHNEFPEVKTNA